MHQKIALCASVLALSLTVSASVSAQPASPNYPGPVAALPPHEILTSVRSTGLEPLSRPMRFGPAYSLRAADAAGREVRVIADARTGRILTVDPVLFPRYVGPPPPNGRPPGRIAAVPDGHSPNSRIATLPPGAEGPPPGGPAAGGLPAVQAPAAVAPRPAAQAGPPPLPRPRPKLAAVDSTVAPPVTSAAPQAQPQVEPQADTKQVKEGETTGTVAPAAAPSAPVEELE